MMTSHEMVRIMAMRLGDEESHLTKEDLQKDAKKEYIKAEKRFRETLKGIKDEDVADHVRQEAMMMVYAYGDLYAEKGIRLGMRFMAEQVFSPEKEEGRAV